MVASARDPLRVPAQFWQRDEVALALEQRDIASLFLLLRRYCGASQTRIGTAVAMSQSTVSLIVNRDQTVTALAVLERIADGLDMPDDSRMRLGLAPKEDPMKRRTALGLGLVGALSPETLTTVLRECAAEAMEFTRERAVSSVGIGMLDHLSAVIAELDRTYQWQPPGDLLPVARAYRQRVAQLINGQHTLREARELYVQAAHLSYLLSDLAFDLGSRVTAEAYAIDCYRHADQAGHEELCAWACSSLSCWASHAGRPDKVVTAAERGISRAPRHNPIAARLHSMGALGYALQGDRTACDEWFAAAQNLCDRLPDKSPSRLGSESNAHTSAMIAMRRGLCYNWMAGYSEAERHSREALASEALSPGDANLVRIHLGIALANLGSPDEAVEQGKVALSQPPVLGALFPRARELDAVLMGRYPTESCAQDFHEQYRLLASRALTN